MFGALDERALVEVEEQFRIDSESAAEWLLGKLATIEAEETRIKAQSEKRLAELAADRNSLMSRFGDDLRLWARQEADRRRRQTVTTLQGTLAFRAFGAGIKITDVATAQKTARLVCPSAFTERTVEDFDKDAFLAHAEKVLSESGEILAGIERMAAGETFSIQFPKKEAKEKGKPPA